MEVDAIQSILYLSTLPSLFSIVCLGMAVVSLADPKVGLFFAVRPKRTRLRGVAFWLPGIFFFFSIVMLLTLKLVNLADPAAFADGSYSFPRNLAIGALAVTGVLMLLMLFFLRRYPRGWKPEETADARTAPQVYQPEAPPVFSTEDDSCSCRDWTVWRAGFPFGHPARLCPHLTARYAADPAAAPARWQSFMETVKNHAANNWGLHVSPHSRWGDAPDGHGWYAVSDSPKAEWIYLYYKGENFAFNTREGIWADCREPLNSGLFTAMLRGGIEGGPDGESQDGTRPAKKENS